jgi:hypothetical protein
MELQASASGGENRAGLLIGTLYTVQDELFGTPDSEDTYQSAFMDGI